MKNVKSVKVDIKTQSATVTMKNSEAVFTKEAAVKALAKQKRYQVKKVEVVAPTNRYLLHVTGMT